MGTPIINLPQTGGYFSALFGSKLTVLAVLGLHAIKDKPVVVDGKIEIRPVCDHLNRACVDGSLANAQIDDVPCPDI